MDSVDTQAAGGGVSSSEIIFSVLDPDRSRIWRRSFAKAIRILPEKNKMIAEKTPKKTAKIWNNIPPVFGSIYIQPPQGFDSDQTLYLVERENPAVQNL
jgi:hypothetical protein